MCKCEYLLKDMTVGAGTKAAYKAVSDEQVRIMVRNAMIDQKVIGYITEINKEIDKTSYVDNYGKNKIQYTYEVKGIYTFFDIEDKSSLDVPFVGYSLDNGDKADGKALTYALKYMFMNTFAIPTGNDKDKVHSNSIETPTKDNKNLDHNGVLPMPEMKTEKHRELYDLLNLLVEKHKFPIKNYNAWIDSWNKFNSSNIQDHINQLTNKYKL